MDSYDFIIVGGGAAGCVLASRLANALKHQKVLLIDAGGTNSDPDHQSYGERHWTLMTAPGYNWGYKTVPQEQLGGREIDYSRGKGLGGSTAINFCVYTRGSSADYDRWAQLVRDDVWSWKHVIGRFSKVETFHQPSQDYQHYVEVLNSAHGRDGPVDVSLPKVWEPGFGEFLDGICAKYPKNLDHNSGNPLGISVCQIAALNSRRVTASGAYLSNPPSNLTILTDALVEKILLKGQEAVGVKVSGKKIFAREEVILAAGAIDTPKLLLLSGIGPRDGLAKHDIPIVKELAGVGKNLYDRLFLELVTTRAPGSHNRTSYVSTPEALEDARKQWIANGKGPLLDYYLPQMIGYFKSEEVLRSEEFQELNCTVQEALRAETKPHYEIFTHNPSPSVQAPEQYLAIAVAFQGAEGCGEVELRSADPKDPPLINPKFLTNPFDRRVAIEAVRGGLDFLDTEFLAKDQVHLAAGPKGRSDEDILEYARNVSISMWHMCGTVKMGLPQEADTCVDNDFRVIGVHRLRIADMSVAPLLVSAHTQAVAYLIGETAAEKIVSEYT